MALIYCLYVESQNYGNEFIGAFTTLKKAKTALKRLDPSSRPMIDVHELDVMPEKFVPSKPVSRLAKLVEATLKDLGKPILSDV